MPLLLHKIRYILPYIAVKSWLILYTLFTGIILFLTSSVAPCNDIAEEYNGEVIATAVGDLLVARKLKDEDGLFGRKRGFI